MYQSNRLNTLFVAFCGFILASCATTMPEMAPSMQTVGKGYIPAGYRDFCTRNPSDCGQRRSRDKQIALDEQTWDILVAVNTEINRKIRPASDRDAYGKAEFWTLPTVMGDCEDYALAKQLALTSKGIPDAALSIATAMDPGLGLHAVLMVRTDRGDFVLDNKTSAIRSWDNTPYQWISRQSAYHAMVWERPTFASASVLSTRSDDRSREDDTTASAEPGNDAVTASFNNQENRLIGLVFN